MTDQAPGKLQDNNVLRLETSKTDAEKATEYKKQLGEALKPICEIMGAAKRDNIMLSWSIQHDALNRFFLASLMATKEL